jgi:hypothetical protein
MAQYIQLIEKNEQGQIVKNEQYAHEDLKKIVVSQNDAFFNKPYRRKQRHNALEVIFETMQFLTDIDKPGKHRVELRDK